MNYIHGDFVFEMVLPQELPLYWQKIEPGLASIKANKPEWDVEQLPVAIHANRANLFIMIRASRYAGFIITRSKFCGIPVAHYLEVVGAHREDWCRQYGGASEHIVGFLVEYGKALGCSRILAESTQFGMERLLKPLGFTLKSISLVKEL